MAVIGAEGRVATGEATNLLQLVDDDITMAGDILIKSLLPLTKYP